MLLVNPFLLLSDNNDQELMVLKDQGTIFANNIKSSIKFFDKDFFPQHSWLTFLHSVLLVLIGWTIDELESLQGVETKSITWLSNRVWNYDLLKLDVVWIVNIFFPITAIKSGISDKESKSPISFLKVVFGNVAPKWLDLATHLVRSLLDHKLGLWYNSQASVCDQTKICPLGL